IIPFDVRPNDRALIARRMYPVDPWPAFDRIDRTRRAQDQHRHAITPGVKDRHGGVKQAYVGMQCYRHRLPGHLGITVRDRDRVLLVQAQKYLRIAIAEIVDEAVVQAAEARAGNERDIGQRERAQRVGDDVAAILWRRWWRSGWMLHRRLLAGTRGGAVHAAPASAEA